MKHDWIGSLALHLRQKIHHLQKSSPLVKNGLTSLLDYKLYKLKGKSISILGPYTKSGHFLKSFVGKPVLIRRVMLLRV